MGLFDKIKGMFSEKKEEEGEEDYFKIASDFEAQSMYNEAINEYAKLIAKIYPGKDYTKYRHVTIKMLQLFMKLGNYERVIELWPQQYLPEEYGPRQKLELALILEKVGKLQEAMSIYVAEEGKLQLKKIEFLLRHKKVDEANKECTRLLLSWPRDNHGIEAAWMLKGKILMSISRWEEAESYFVKVLERQGANLEAKNLRHFCSKQIKR